MKNVLTIPYIHCKKIYKFYIVIYQLNSTTFSWCLSILFHG